MVFALYKLIAIISILITLSGCAGISTIPVGNPGQKTDQDARGIRHWGPKVPFILVMRNIDNQITSEIIYLADTTQLFSTRPYAFMASNEATIGFSKGVLGDTKAIVKETKIPMIALSALQKIAENLVSKMAMADAIPGSTSIELTEPAIFRVFVNKYGVLSARGHYRKQNIIFSLQP